MPRLAALVVISTSLLLLAGRHVSGVASPDAPRSPGVPKAALAGSSVVTIPGILETLAESVPAWEQQLTNVVAEERYSQRWIAYSAQANTTQLRRRELVSDLLLVKIDDAKGLVPFRDVFEVDGRPVRDRDDRLVKLFIHPTPETLAQARAIVGDGARFNIGGGRNVNVPLMALAFLEPNTQSRFKFSGSRLDDRRWRLSFEETRRPTLIRGPDDRDMAVNGTITVDAARGTVEETAWNVSVPRMRLSVTVAFAVDPRLNINVPVTMREDFWDGRGELTGRATYSNYRHFEVQITETTRP